MTDDQLAYIEEFCTKIRTRLDNANFETKRQTIELLGIRGKVAFENGEKVLYLKCLIEPCELQQVLRIPIWRSSSNHTLYANGTNYSEAKHLSKRLFTQSFPNMLPHKIALP